MKIKWPHIVLFMLSAFGLYRCFGPSPGVNELIRLCRLDGGERYIKPCMLMDILKIKRVQLAIHIHFIMGLIIMWLNPLVRQRKAL